MPASPTETIADLIDRLGEPPESVVDTWCDQLRDAAIDWEKHHDEAFPPIDLSLWSIGTQGELCYQSACYPCPSAPRSTLSIRGSSRAQIASFRAAVLASTAADNVPQPTEIAAAKPGFDSADAATGVADLSPPQKVLAAKRRWVVAASLLIVGGVVVTILKTRVPSERSARATPSPFPSSQASQSLPTQTADPIASDDLTMRLETFDSKPLDPNGSEPLIDLQPILSIENLLPAVSSPLDRETDVEKYLLRATEHEISADVDAKPATAFRADSDAEVTETPQSIRIAAVAAVALPEATDENKRARIGHLSPNTLSLQFPIDVAVELNNDESAGHHVIHDCRRKLEIASLTRDQQELVFGWSPQAKDSTVAALLQHGRLRDEHGNAAYLRAGIEADPWSMVFDQSDYRPSWDLGAAVLPQVTRLSLQLDLPETIELGWMEPPKPDHLRRARSLAVLSNPEFEQVQIAILFNVHCTRKLSCEIRHAARLDPSLPWQTFTEPGIQRLANQLLARNDQFARLQDQIEAWYEHADSTQRRQLRTQRDQLKSSIEWSETLSTRVAQLQTMVAELKQDGKIRCELYVRWPDGDQPLLTMPEGGNRE
ncbi:hypothetical protein [Novipirellula artificiosorum]|uniref:Transmembrane protein n=1 Tax=Novipirellula artificiosorum TaxID=2528016 RepID=A0A5C6E6R2_9BACT|nr:hypothetical protein [Novipirellula artificiosorum]TWU42869.1 hypothetical protein Poly41_11700 [Novipirellula artificiosorum]